MYISKSGSLWLHLHRHLSGNRETSPGMNLSAVPASCASVHITEQSWTMQTEIHLEEAENWFPEGTSCLAMSMKHSGLDTGLELVHNSSPDIHCENCQHRPFSSINLLPLCCTAC